MDDFSLHGNSQKTKSADERAQLVSFGVTEQWLMSDG